MEKELSEFDLYIQKNDNEDESLSSNSSSVAAH